MSWTACFDHVCEYPPASATFRWPRGGGVYALTDADDRLIQLASAANLARALAGRLETEQPDESLRSSRRADLRAIVRRILWTQAHSVFETSYTYWRIARQCLPDRYLEQVGFGPCWFVHADPEAAFPRLEVDKYLSAPPGVDLGPFATSGDAQRFAQLLEDGFDLCRYPHILEQAPHGEACAYFDMGKCPAPCSGRIPMSQYRESMAAALSFAGGERSAVYQRIEGEMKTAAAGLAFERARAIQQTLERLRGIEHRGFRHVRPLDDFNYLIVQRGPTRSLVTPFFVRDGWITAGSPVRLKQLETALPTWLQAMDEHTVSQPHSGDYTDQRMRCEQVWLVSHYLFKKDVPGLFLHAKALGVPMKLAKQIRRAFHSVEKVKGRSIQLVGILLRDNP